MSLTMIGLIGVIVVFVFIFLNMPIGISLALVGFIGLGIVRGMGGGLSILAVDTFRTSASYIFCVIPLFVSMGFLASKAGLSDGAFEAINKWIGHWRGGLAMATTGACAMFAAICGGAVATATTVAAVALPQMRKYKYDDVLSLGVLAAGGNLGFLIPPSMGFMLYAIITNQSIGILFISGVLPGLLLTALFMMTIWLMCRINPKLASPSPSASWKERFVALRLTIPSIILIVLVLGGIYAGIFTPTEAGAVGVFGVIVIGLANRRLTWQGFTSALREAAKLYGMVFILIIGTMIYSRFLVVTEVPMFLSETIAVLDVSPYIVLIICLTFYILIGFIMDIMAMLMLTVPILHPVLVALGFDPVWLAVLTIITVLMGHISPPVGIVVFGLAGYVRDVPVDTIFRGVLPFLLTMLVCLAILIAVPEISLLLPNLMRPG